MYARFRSAVINNAVSGGMHQSGVGISSTAVFHSCVYLFASAEIGPDLLLFADNDKNQISQVNMTDRVQVLLLI